MTVPLRNVTAGEAGFEEDPEALRDRLQAARCTRIFTEKGAGGARALRPEWDRCLDRLKNGDTLVCTKLDRIGRSVRNLMYVSSLLQQHGIDLVRLAQPIGTTSPQGKLFFTMLAGAAFTDRLYRIQISHS
jgi:DNA invertase Pin-like site-specific DNA recombinase